MKKVAIYNIIFALSFELAFMATNRQYVYREYTYYFLCKNRYRRYSNIIRVTAYLFNKEFSLEIVRIHIIEPLSI